MQQEYSKYQPRIEQLLFDIRGNFSDARVLSKNVYLASGGDDDSMQRITDILDYRPWSFISLGDFYACGCDEIRMLTKSTLIYYLPALLIRTLEEGKFRCSRLCEITCTLLLPSQKEYEDVWEYFGGGALSYPHGQMQIDLIEKIDYLFNRLEPSQRECVARYIEIAESYGIENPTEEFQTLLKKYIDFWRAGYEHAS